MAKQKCGSLSGNANDICEAEAKGNENIAKAELEAKYKPSEKARYKAWIAKADAHYKVAKERCDDKSGNVKDVCMKEAKAEHVRAKADAKVQMKSVQAEDKARDTAAEANMDAKGKMSDVRQDATKDKRAADFAVAKEKCEAYSGDAKSRCVNQAKAQFGM